MRRLSASVRLAITIALAGVVAALTVVLVAPQLQQVVTAGEWSHTEVSLNETPTRSLVYDSRGNLMATWFRDNRSPIALEYMPDKVIEAIIAIEDADFYQHQGINLKAIGRSVVENVDAGGISQGGSTITQQLIKNLVLTDEQTVERKIQEASLAVRLEDQMTKDQILEAYLNTVFFGSGAYGVKAAAEVYFGLDTANVSDEEAAVILEEGIGWPEAALLASLISNPTANDPTLNPDTSRYQRSIVLERLADLELITPEEAAELQQHADPDRAPAAHPTLRERLLPPGGPPAAARRRALPRWRARVARGDAARRWPADLHELRPSQPAHGRGRPHPGAARRGPEQPADPVPLHHVDRRDRPVQRRGAGDARREANGRRHRSQLQPRPRGRTPDGFVVQDHQPHRRAARRHPDQRSGQRAGSVHVRQRRVRELRQRSRAASPPSRR